MKADFTEKLLEWNVACNDRQMPWKGEQDPYRIWISEIILQQTRVEQGLAYYQRFINNFPDVHALAQASDEHVFKIWEGLGYYSRCKNLLHTARHIASELDGKFPDNYEQILKLKGIGPYTASAIASFAFGEKCAVVDGNVQRVLSRYFGISTPVDSKSGKHLFDEIAQSLIPHDQPGKYNQAIMDFGATVCRPRNPLCVSCIQQPDCQAYRHDNVHKLPVKEKKASRRSRWLNYFIVRCDGYVYIRKRKGADIWQNLHEFLLFETDKEWNEPINHYIEVILPNSSYQLVHTAIPRPQQLSHQTIHGKFFVIDLAEPAKIGSDYMLVEKSNLDQYAFPRLITSFLHEYAV
jgi:A/G-specific adenine glycosylase